MSSNVDCSEPTYIVATVQIWDEEALKTLALKAGTWRFCHTASELNDLLLDGEPRYIFFLHWRWIVPKHIVETIECVCFHMTDLPFGRGGSPLQNLILRDINETQLSALRMTDILDAGPIYYKEPLPLNGTAAEIYLRSEALSILLIAKIITSKPIPEPQVGTPVFFKRRTPNQSELPEGLDGRQLYNFIRMLDAPGYPKAFCYNNGYKMELSEASLTDFGAVTAHVQFNETKSSDDK